MKDRGRLPDMVALVVVAAIGLPVVVAGASAFAEGERRRREMPVRSMLGNEAYDRLSRGEPYPQHYMQRPPIGALAEDLPVLDPANDRLAPDFTLQQADGTPWNLREHRGKVVVMNFWSITCPPCIEEMPSLQSLARIVRDRDDIVVVTIATDRTWDEVRTVVPDDDELTVLLDPDRAITRGEYGTVQFPETWIIDPQGVVRLRVDGPRDWSSAVAIEVMESYL